MDFREIKQQAKTSLVGKRLMFLLAILVAGIVGGAIPGLNIIIGPILTAGVFLIGMDLLKGKDFSFDPLFAFFKDFDHGIKIVITNLLVLLIVVGGFILFIVPGVIFAFRYSQATYVMIEDKSLDPLAALKESRRLMQGYKWNLFVFGLTFIGHILLGMITFGIYFLFVLPYIQLSMYNYYTHLKALKPQVMTE